MTFSDAEPNGLDIKKIAAIRWKAVVAFNCAPNLTPIARRLGIHLISKMDARTRACFPGEARLAAELGCDDSSITRAKNQLKEAGLISWELPMGRRQGCTYSFDFDKLATLASIVKEVGDRAVNEVVQTRTLAGMAKRQTRNSEGLETGGQNSKPSFDIVQTLIQDVPNPHFEEFIPAPVRPYLIQDIVHYAIQQITPPQAEAVNEDVPALDSRQYRIKLPQGTTSTTPLQSKLTTKHPRLKRLFDSSLATINSDATLDSYDLSDAEGMVLSKGRDAVVNFLKRKGVNFPAEVGQT